MWQVSIIGVLLLVVVIDSEYSSLGQLVYRRIGRNTDQFLTMVLRHGYYGEEHEVTTEDGYILTQHRIAGGPRSPPAPGKPVVILIHGLFASSDLWVLRGPKDDLAFLLADEGYDVWIINARGNFYSRRHRHLRPSDPEFWRFSWHEMGLFDLPATIDYVQDLTGRAKVFLIGHSMGTTIEFVFLSMRPEYNEKVDAAICLAPVAFFTHGMPGMLHAFTINYGNELERMAKHLGVYELFPRSSVDLYFLTSMCKLPKIDNLCLKLIFYLVGSPDYEQFDSFIIPTLVNHYPAGSSLEAMQHFRQILLSGKFRQYDFGEALNYVFYKNQTPPAYPLEKVTAPVILYYGQNDPITTESDVQAIARVLPNAISRRIPYPKFNHLDFVLSKDSKVLLYDDIIEGLNELCEENSLK